jgi:hypothetical protein
MLEHTIWHSPQPAPAFSQRAVWSSDKTYIQEVLSNFGRNVIYLSAVVRSLHSLKSRTPFSHMILSTETLPKKKLEVIHQAVNRPTLTTVMLQYLHTASIFMYIRF